MLFNENKIWETNFRPYIGKKIKYQLARDSEPYLGTIVEVDVGTVTIEKPTADSLRTLHVEDIKWLEILD